MTRDVSPSANATSDVMPCGGNVSSATGEMQSRNAGGTSFRVKSAVLLCLERELVRVLRDFFG